MKISLEEVDRILQAQGPRGTNGNGHGKADETVEALTRSEEVHRVKQLVDEAPDLREDLVEELRAQIESGTYQVSGADIADLMVRRAFADRIR